MKLATLQRRFLETLCADEGEADRTWDAELRPGLRVYRNAYRSRLLECLRESYPRTRKWIGDEAFDTAARHHLIAHPPASWSLDHVGRAFSATLQELFPADPEVEELAWLEAAMQDAFTGLDTRARTPDTFAAATAGWGEHQWARLRFAFVPTLRERTVTTSCAQLWQAIEAEDDPPAALRLAEPATLVVWREGLRPRFEVLDGAAAEAFALARRGAGFGEICRILARNLGELRGAAEAGAALGHWIAQAMLADDERPLSLPLRD